MNRLRLLVFLSTGNQDTNRFVYGVVDGFAPDGGAFGFVGLAEVPELDGPGVLAGFVPLDDGPSPDGCVLFVAGGAVELPPLGLLGLVVAGDEDPGDVVPAAGACGDPTGFVA